MLCGLLETELEGDGQKMHIFGVYFDNETGISASSKFYLSGICTILWQCKAVVCLSTRKYSLCSSERDKENKTKQKKIHTTALSDPHGTLIWTPLSTFAYYKSIQFICQETLNMWKSWGLAQQEDKFPVLFPAVQFSNSRWSPLWRLFAVEGYLRPEAKLQMSSSTQFQGNFGRVESSRIFF